MSHRPSRRSSILMLLKKSNETETKLSDGEIDWFQVEEEASDSLKLEPHYDAKDVSKEAAMEAALQVPKLEIITKKKASDMDIEPEYRGRRNEPSIIMSLL